MNETANSDLVTIFILNWNQYNKICQAIDSALNQTYSNCEILVLDNGSTDGSSDLIKKTYPSISLIQLDKNYGCPGGRNRGIPYCSGDYIFFADDDGILHKDAVKNAMKIMLTNNEIGIVTGKVIDINRLNDFSAHEMSDKTYEVGIFQGGISLHRKYIYDKISKYPDDFMYGGEETFLSLKLLDKNVKIVRDETVILFHPLNSISNKSEQRKRSFENIFVIAYRLYPIPLFLVFVVYYSFVYFFYTIRFGFFYDYFKIYRKAIIRARKHMRTPVKLSTFFKFRNLNRILM